MRSALTVLAALGLAACASMPDDPGAGLRSIAYETGPCFGACPVYRVTVDSDGRGVFEGRRFTAVTGIRAFRIPEGRFRRLARHLQPLRPERGSVSYSGETCATIATDLPSVDVTWRSIDGSAQSLHFYYGCDMERNRDMAERLGEAPRLLPITELIGIADER